jgi:hypothetical protein
VKHFDWDEGYIQAWWGSVAGGAPEDSAGMTPRRGRFISQDAWMSATVVDTRRIVPSLPENQSRR